MTESQGPSDERQDGTVKQAGPGQDGPARDVPAQGQPVQSTAWTSSGRTPLRQFLRTETGSATILVLATLAALI
jgi:hypothetical protein